MRFGARKSRKIAQSAILTSREGLSELLPKIANRMKIRNFGLILRDSYTIMNYNSSIRQSAHKAKGDLSYEMERKMD